MQCSEHNKYQQMNIIMVKCSGMESRMTRGRIIWSSTRTPKEEKPSKPFIPFRWLALPKTLHWKLHTGKLMSREGSIQGCISSKPLNYVSPVDFFSFLPTLSCISLPTTQGAIKRETWLSETESHHVGSGATRCQSECCIRAGET